MKKIFWLAVLVAVWAAGAEKYNYYERNFADGSFSLENLDLPPEMEFSYESVADAGGVVTTEVRGYYYQSDKLKFIDTIEGGKIMKIQYFAPDGVEIFVRTHAYDGERLCEFEIVTNEEYVPSCYNLKSTFDYKNQRYSIVQSHPDFHFVYDGKLNKDGKPISGKVTRANSPHLSGLEEKWTYGKDRVKYQVVLRKGIFSYKFYTHTKSKTESVTTHFNDSVVFEYIQQHENPSFFELLVLRLFGTRYTKYRSIYTENNEKFFVSSNSNPKEHLRVNYDFEVFKGKLMKSTDAMEDSGDNIIIFNSGTVTFINSCDERILFVDNEKGDRALALPCETEIANDFHSDYMWYPIESL